MSSGKINESAWGGHYRSAEKPPIRVVVVEDDKTARNLLTEVIGKSPSLRLLKAFPDAESALRSIAALRPQVVIMDIQLPKSNGIECARILKQRHPDIQIVMFTVFADSAHVMEAIKAGASGYLLKRSSTEDMVRGIEQVCEGGAPMSPGIARMVVESLHAPESSQDNKREIWHLTVREHEILQLLAKGYAAKEISCYLNISDPTIRFHLKNIYGKLHVHSRTEAVLKFIS